MIYMLYYISYPYIIILYILSFECKKNIYKKYYCENELRTIIWTFPEKFFVCFNLVC